MAIRYDPEYNKEIRRVVKNFNQSVRRAMKRGTPKNALPDVIKVRNIKALYDTRAELNRQLAQIEKFKIKDLKTYVTTKSGQQFRKWQYDYLQLNVEQAKEYFRNRRDAVAKRIKRGFAGETMRLDNINSKLQTLSIDPEKMTESQYRSYTAAINEFLNAPAKKNAGYRGFLTEVDEVMKRTGVPKSEANKFFAKFKQLTPDQFLYLYENADIIDRVFDLIDSPVHDNKMKMNTSDTDARKLVDILLEETDELVSQAQDNA